MTMCSAAESTPEPTSGGGVTATMNAVVKPPDTAIRNPNRRSNKPIMEKRRRARINNCLNELKGILLEAMRKDPARHSKLEKADILELTVSHLKALHRHHSSITTDSASRFRAGFAECAAEVGRFLSSPKSEGIDPQTSGRLLSHLAECINNNNNGPSNLVHPLGSQAPLPNLHHHSGHAPLQTPMDTQSNGLGSNMPVISMVPTRLSSGEIAFVLPGFKPSARRPSPSPPMGMQPSSGPYHCNPPQVMSPEVPLELTVQSSASSYSSSSSASSLSPNYPMSAHHHHHQSPYPPSGHYGAALSSFSPVQQPLALVTPKREEADGSCWRPW